MENWFKGGIVSKMPQLVQLALLFPFLTLLIKHKKTSIGKLEDWWLSPKFFFLGQIRNNDHLCPE